jgi:acyl-CoA synthetase (AMP-forming)/AMP-acid ligase II
MYLSVKIKSFYWLISLFQGTTGFPKGATLTHHGILNNAVCTANVLDYDVSIIIPAVMLADLCLYNLMLRYSIASLRSFKAAYMYSQFCAVEHRGCKVLPWEFSNLHNLMMAWNHNKAINPYIRISEI